MRFLGNIAFDDRVHNAVCKKTPFIDLYPYTQTALDLRECGKILTATTCPSIRNKGPQLGYFDEALRRTKLLWLLTLRLRPHLSKSSCLSGDVQRYRSDSIVSYPFFSRNKGKKS